MQQLKIHFCMVSGQAAPNLLPLLDEELKPEKVVLLVTPAMKEQAEHLERVILPRGIKVEQKEFIVNDDFQSMQERLLEMIAEEVAEPDQIALNATGGTKWMAIAVQEVFRLNDSPVFYVDVSRDQVQFLDKNRHPHGLTQRIDLKSYIQAYGFEIREAVKPTGLKPELRELCQQLVLRVDDWQQALSQLNLLASAAQERNTLSIDISGTLSGTAAPQLPALLHEFEHAGMLKENDGKLTFSSKESSSFANGGWLEAYVNSTLNTLKGEGVIQDGPYLNLHIQRFGKTSHNEIDACFMAGNSLHLIECKTRRMSGKRTAGVATDTVYKLDSISDLGGLTTKSMLVSYSLLNEPDSLRARDLKIKVVQGRQLQQLKDELKKWIQGRQ